MFQERKVNEGQLVKDFSVRDTDEADAVNLVPVHTLSQEAQRVLRERIIEERSKAGFDYNNRHRQVVLDGTEFTVDVVDGTVRHV